jgi:hypothetical protein
MTEEMLRVSRTVMKAMLQIMEKTSSGPEMREVLKQVWGLDDQAATAATLALRRGGFDSMMDEMETFKEQTKDRKPVDIETVKGQTQEFVRVMGVGNKGIEGVKNVLQSFFANPIMASIAGIGGLAMSGLLQALQMGAGVAVAGACQKSGMTGVLKGVTTRLVGMAGNVASLGKTALMGAGKLGLVGAAGVGAYMAMTKLRETFPIIDEFTQYIADNMMRAVDTVTFGLFKFGRTLNEEEAHRKGLLSVLDQQSEAGERTRRVFANLTDVVKRPGAAGAEQTQQASRFLTGLSSREELMGVAEEIAKRTKMDEGAVLSRLREIQRARTKPTGRKTPRAPEARATRREMRAPELSVAQQAAAQPGLLANLPITAPMLADAAAPGAPGGLGGLGGMVRQGGTSVGPDGTINIRVMIPRHALDKSNLMASAATE